MTDQNSSGLPSAEGIQCGISQEIPRKYQRIVVNPLLYRI